MKKYDDGFVKEDSSSYLERSGPEWGGAIRDEENIQDELRKRGLCCQTLQGRRGAKTDSVYWKLLKCYRWFCRTCGKDKGPIHKRRITRVLAKLGGRSALKDWMGYEIIFTVPESERWRFASRRGINQLQGMALRCVKKFFPEKHYLLFFHAFGDDRPGVFHPHVPILILESKSYQRMELPKEVVQGLKDNWSMRLKKFGCRIDKIDIWSNFFTKPAHLFHKIKYNCKLHPGPEDLEEILKSEDLSKLFIASSDEKFPSMKGFPYAKYCGKFRDKKGCTAERDLESCTSLLAEEEDESKAREKLLWTGVALTWCEFHCRYKKWDYDIVNDGLFKIKDEMFDWHGKIVKRRC